MYLYLSGVDLLVQKQDYLVVIESQISLSITTAKTLTMLSFLQ